LEDLIEDGGMQRCSLVWGNGCEGREPAPDDANRMEEGQSVGILIGFEGGFMDQAADREMRHQETIELLAHQIGGPAAQDELAPRRWVLSSPRAVSISQQRIDRKTSSARTKLTRR
jgi:hypothetical protein